MNVLLLTCLSIASACGRGSSYVLEGQVLAVDHARQEITVRHGDIKGFMPGMTMPFKVREPALIAGRVPGELIRATLVVEDSLGYLSTIAVTGKAPLATAAPGPTMMVLAPGEEVPDGAFRDVTGARRTLADWRGRVVVIPFVYTRCPIPDFCPLMDRHFAAIQSRLTDDATLGRDNVHLLSVSIDPQHDTPEVLREHARRAGARTETWSYLTGDPSAITSFAARFGVAAMRDDAEGAEVVHNLRTAVIDAQGRLTYVFSGNEWTVEALVAEIKRAAGPR